MKYLPYLLFGGLAVTVAVAIKRDGFPGSEKSNRIKAIKANMAQALATGNDSVYELHRLELENEREL